MKTIIEGGHFYVSKGYNALSHKGWKHAITELNGSKQDSVMMFIDDVHPVDNLSDMERLSQEIPANILTNKLRASINEGVLQVITGINRTYTQSGSVKINPHYIEIESGVNSEAVYALEELKKMSKKKQAKRSSSGSWFCSGARLTHEDGYTPTCTGFDLGLTLKKFQLGYQRAINILPVSYQEQQEALRRLVERVLGSQLELVNVFYDEKGDIVDS